MISLEDAQERLLALAKPVSAETIPLAQAARRILAQDVRAIRTQPARDLSAMDGYAVRAADSAGPWTVIGESAAGSPFVAAIGPYEAARIFTGAIMPNGADAVIMQEDVIREANTITLCNEVKISNGKHVRAAGSDFARNDFIATAGLELTPAHIGLLALAGHWEVAVRRRVKVAFLSTGDELLPLGTLCDDAHIPASNAVMLATLIADTPSDVLDHGIIADDLPAITDAIKAAHDADILVTIGGASVGDHDLVRPALLNAGAQIDFWKVAMRPGKPLMAGTLNRQIVVGLPGNPVSAYVTALLLLKPLIAALSGAQEALPKQQSAHLTTTLPANGSRTDHIRARLENGAITPLSSQDSAGLQALSLANALIIRAPNAPSAAKGDQVFVLCA
jgi:molybdopterin molybdotransferase